MTTGARYDGLADWYDGEFQPAPLESEAWDVLASLLGEGTGRLLDVGCGTGSYTAALAERGWDATGVDISVDMLRRARERGVHAVQADATQLPFEDASFAAAVSVLTNTDLDDLAAVVREIVRVLRPGAPLVYLAVHPCFVGPHSVYDPERGRPELHAGWYRRAGRYDEAPGIWRSSGLRVRVGASHLPLGLFLQAFVDVGLTLERIEEPEEREYPFILGLRWRRP
ncbi:MAG TPA: class I SAM-dependent methyltransferase [Gaiellaceae bacterium]|nr:class I SAM-dependent methyltransferase [Gaiellaceae bacterium]